MNPMARRNGFTLIEVLIAMTLLGIMVVLLFSSLKIAAESWNAGENKIVEVNRKAVVYQFFKRHLTTIRPVLMDDESVEAGVDQGMMQQQAFQGHSQMMRFVAGLPAASARKGLQVFEIAPDPNESSTITVRLTPYQESEPTTPEPPVVLLKDVKAYSFAYFGKKDDASEMGWQDEWLEAESLPQLIKVDISLKDGSYWPDMVFPVKITGLPAIANGGGDNSDAMVP